MKIPMHKSGLNILELFLIVMAVVFTIAYSTHAGDTSTNINEKPSKSPIQQRNSFLGTDVPPLLRKPDMTLTERYTELRSVSSLPETIRKPTSGDLTHGKCS